MLLWQPSTHLHQLPHRNIAESLDYFLGWEEVHSPFAAVPNSTDLEADGGCYPEPTLKLRTVPIPSPRVHPKAMSLHMRMTPQTVCCPGPSLTVETACTMTNCCERAERSWWRPWLHKLRCNRRLLGEAAPKPRGNIQASAAHKPVNQDSAAWG